MESEESRRRTFDGKPADVIVAGKGNIVSSFLLSSTAETSCRWGFRLWMDIVPPPSQPPFICKTSSGETKAEGRLWRDLGGTDERRMRGGPVILNRLIIRMFWIKCKNEGKRRNDRLGEGGSIFPYIKNIPGFLKKMVMFLRNIKVFFENIKVFLHPHRATHTVA